MDATARRQRVKLRNDQSPLSASLARTVERRFHLRTRDGHAATITGAEHQQHPVYPVARTPVTSELDLTVRPTVHLDHHEVEPVAISPTRLLIPLPTLGACNGWPGRRRVTSSHNAPAPPLDGNDSGMVGILQLLLAQVIWFAWRRGRTLLDAALVQGIAWYRLVIPQKSLQLGFAEGD